MRYFQPSGTVATQNGLPSGFLRARMGSNRARNPGKQALSPLMARVVEANIDLRGGPNGVGRARGRGRFRSGGDFSLCEVKGARCGAHRP